MAVVQRPQTIKSMEMIRAEADLSVQDRDGLSACLGALTLAEGPELGLQEAYLMLSAAGAHIDDLHIQYTRISSSPHLKTHAECSLGVPV